MQAGTYSFDQLSDKLKEEAIESNRDINVFDDWYDYAIEGFKEDLAGDGVDVDDVQFTGFYSQGDGASFTGEVKDMKNFLVKSLGMTQFSDEELADLPESIKEKVQGFIDTLTISFNRKSSRYVHENTCETSTYSEIVHSNYYEDEYPGGKIYLLDKFVGVNPPVFMDLEEEVEGIEEAAEDWRLDICRELYRDLESEYDELQSDDAVAETLESNGSEFEVDEDGDLI
jgi:hypothetical protein